MKLRAFAPGRLLIGGLMFAFLLNTTPIFARSVTTLTHGWKFAPGEHTLAFQENYDDSQWQSVSVPHDWAIAGPVQPGGDPNTGKLPWKGEGWYRLEIDVPASQTPKTWYLVCDGIMAFPEIYLNGQLVGTWDYGYNSFYLDLTQFLVPGKKNHLAIHADTRQHDSRWYPGAGIFRKIQLLAVDPVHVGVWGTYVTTPIVKPNLAEVQTTTTIWNKNANATDSFRVEQVILAPNGREVARKFIRTRLAGASHRDIGITLTLANPQRWDLETPVMYTLKTIIRRGDDVLDTYETPFGIRTMRFTADHGFYLNDRRVQFKGVNLHHDQGPLGAAFYVRAMERQLEIMKSMGVNAVRTSHNMPAPELLDLCDRMGILVFDEAFDKYDLKADLLSGVDFDEFAQRNIRNFVERDRNHPSVFIWSVGNEMGDIQYNIDNGFRKLNTMVSYVNKYDPSRPTTMACDNQPSAALRHFDYYDIHSWNYNRRYSLARQLEPNKAVIVSESASALSTRGFYEFPLPKLKTDFTAAMQLSSYDFHAPYWAEIADDDFMWQQDEAYIAGEFVWTGFDYLGEPTPYDGFWVKEGAGARTNEQASRSSYFGIVDLCGFPKDRYYLYKSYWMPEEATVHILPHWNWAGREGQQTPVFVYTNGDCAELFVNGKSQGMQCKTPGSDKSIERFRLMWNDVVYQPGEVTAIAYREGVKIGETVVKTAGKPHHLVVSADRTTLHADGLDLAYLTVSAVDAQGNFCPLADDQVNFELKGPIAIAGVGNGNAQSLEEFQATGVKLFYGKALLIVKTHQTSGSATVTASARGLAKATVSLTLN